jgi:hypothetical protein
MRLQYYFSALTIGKWATIPPINCLNQALH